MKEIMLLVGLTFIAGCDSSGNLGQEESPAWHSRTSVAEKVAYFKPKCEAYGFKDGTTEMANCLRAEVGGSESYARSKMSHAFDTPTTATNPTRRNVDFLGDYYDSLERRELQRQRRCSMARTLPGC